VAGYQYVFDRFWESFPNICSSYQSWFIGKVAPSNVPPTPSTSVPAHLNSSGSDDANPLQVSPMSSAFPPVQTRTTTTAI
jgi:hypothetical protein